MGSLFFKKKSFKALSIALKSSGGKTSSGRSSLYHRGGGALRVYRYLDHFRYIYNIPGFVLRIEYNPVYNTLVAFVCFSNGVLCYITATENLRVGSIVINETAPRNLQGSSGNGALLGNLPPGTFVHNIEKSPLEGAQYLRARGSYGRVMWKEGFFVVVKLKSGDLVRVPRMCNAVLGTLAYRVFKKKIHQKAGFFRNRGWRPVVRGVAMNPVDHPHGGGEGKSGSGRPSVSRWGWLTKNVKKKN